MSSLDITAFVVLFLLIFFMGTQIGYRDIAPILIEEEKGNRNEDE